MTDWIEVCACRTAQTSQGPNSSSQGSKTLPSARRTFPNRSETWKAAQTRRSFKILTIRSLWWASSSSQSHPRRPKAAKFRVSRSRRRSIRMTRARKKLTGQIRTTTLLRRRRNQLPMRNPKTGPPAQITSPSRKYRRARWRAR